MQGIPGCCADVREAAQPYLGDELDKGRDGDLLESVLLVVVLQLCPRDVQGPEVAQRQRAHLYWCLCV